MFEWTCPAPLRNFTHIVLGHGGGGKLTADLFEHLILPAFENPILAEQSDGAVLPPLDGRVVVSTDGFVVRPLFFPGGSIGELAVFGTVNDLAMMGAVPRYLTVSLILEEGLPLVELAEILQRMGAAARRAGVTIVAGDTKVIERSRGDGCLITTTGLGMLGESIELSPAQIEVGDVVLLSGSIAEHGIAVIGKQEGFQFEPEITSDLAPLTDLTQTLLQAGTVRMLRDPTRGGVAATLNEFALASRKGIVIHEAAIPILPGVRSACDLLGLDPLTIANEGKLLAIVPAPQEAAALAALRSHPLGHRACRIGEVVADHPHQVTARTALGSSRLIHQPAGDLLPRIC